MAEYRTTQLVLDHLFKEQMESGSPHFVQKFVMTTETPEQALLKLVAYYAMQDILLDLSTVAILQKASHVKDGIYLLVTPEGVQAVMDYDTWERMAFEPDFGQESYLTATLKFVEAVGAHIGSFRRLPSLSFISMDREVVEEETQERTYTQAEVDALLVAQVAETEAQYEAAAKAGEALEKRPGRPKKA